MQNMVVKKCNKETLQILSKGRIKLKSLLEQNNIIHEFTQEKIYVTRDDNIDIIIIYNQESVVQMKLLLQSLDYNFANAIKINVLTNNRLEVLVPYRSYKYTITNYQLSNMLFNIMFTIFNIFFFLFLILIVIFVTLIFTGKIPISSATLYNYLLKIIV